ncbi:DUF2252 family protein [Rhodoferax sp.]|uniref:DUF2252 domain-containing protein n=1 Tax=Rhodoferax sp. TaxID=50421 RepID=UPI0025F8024F|nr:DUF2252 family protein [Rhodoferax sp.]
MDVVKQIFQFNAGRDQERLESKYRKMRGDAFVFLRGTCHFFYERLPRGGIFKSAPLVWSCGDLHFENFGSFKGDNRLPYFDLNDFDESLLAPASWDLVRMLTSLRVGAKSLGVTPADAQALCAAFLDAYATALASGKAYWVEPQTAHGLVGTLLDGLRTRQRASFLNAYTQTKGKKRLLKTDGQKALPVTDSQRNKVLAFMAAFANTQSDPDFYRVIDVARRVAGTGSLGVDRYAILVHGKGTLDGHYLLDLKEALPSALASRVKVKQPKWTSEAQRIVVTQRRVQAVSMAFLQPVSMGKKSYVLRGLQPLEDRLTLNGAKQSIAEIRRAIATMGQIVAWGQLRSSGRQGSAIADELVDFATRPKWQSKLLAVSLECAQHVEQDAATFNCAYDNGAFRA